MPLWASILILVSALLIVVVWPIIRQWPRRRRKQCPDCREGIHPDALVCPFCGHRFSYRAALPAY